MKYLLLLACISSTLYLAGTAFAAEPRLSEFFRVSSSTAETVISSFSPDGWLSWSNSSASGDYLIERTYDLSSPDWAPLTRGTVTNQVMSVRVFDPQPPSGMRFIPGGTFLMGNVLGDATQFAEPTNSVTLSPFYINTCEVTVGAVAEMFQWAYEQGLVTILVTVPEDYVLDQKGTNLMVLRRWNSEINFASNRFVFRAGRDLFPATYISWFGCVSYCNWASLRAGREPCYDLNTWSCDFSRNGCRLPTEAEWEFAARGGYQGRRFPWGDLTTHTNANYKSTTNNWYDVSLTRGYHPDYAGLIPLSNPVGAFAPNNFGLYNMSGNVWEWTWNWSENYTRTPKINPTGPAQPVAGSFRVFRGGSSDTSAERTTCAVRYRAAGPSSGVYDVGFRPVLR
jgi:sulfatase modifying factor 1